MISNFYSNTLYDFTKKHLSEKTIKGIIKQIITAVGFLHSKKYIHRDIKPDNILLDSKGTIKLTDFDLARLLPESNDKPLTRNVVTLYYRAPEIFFGDVHYGKGVDIWSIGCVFGEFFIDEPIFKGACELATLSKIIEMCGNPNEENWPGVEKLPNYLPYGEIKPKLRNEFEGKISKEGVDVLEMMLSLDPKKRPSCEELLNMSYFKENVASKEEIATELNLK